MSKKAIGIDLGTGNSCVAIVENGEVNVIANNEGRKTTPSVVFLKEGEDRKIGDPAKRGMVMNPKNTVSFVKRLMGTPYDNKDVQTMVKSASYKIVNDANKPKIEIDNKKYTPEEISSMILAKMKEIADAYTGTDIKDVVITCPAWFDDNQRQSTKLAGELVGLNVLRIINEPTAAILASDIDVKSGDKNIMVCDFGCGTLDFSVAECSDGMVEIKASYGDTFLGGKDVDDALTNYIIDEFKKDKGIDLAKDPMALARIQEAAEKAKCELSSTVSTDINLPYITVADGVPQMLVMTITRATMDKLIKPLIDRVISCAHEALNKAELSASDLNEILLVGGSCRIIALQDALTQEFGVKLNKTADFDEAVARGAAIQANILVGNTSEDDVVLLDVTPISLGIETMGEVMTKLIDANTTIPTKKTQIFSTAVDNQPGVQIKVLQGERPMSADNKMVGMFNLEGIAPAPKGVPQIEVTFDIDANGILTVSAKDLGTGKDQSITINNSNSLSQEEIDKIKADAEKYKEEDAKKKENIDKVNQAETYSYQVEQTLKDEKFADKFTEEQKTQITELNEKLAEALKDRSNVEAIDAARAELDKIWSPIIQKIYEEAAKEANASQAAQDFANNAGGANPFADGMADMFNGAAGANPFTKA